jgi:SPX domain protein involved in polyphosphate accumulation
MMNTHAKQASRGDTIRRFNRYELKYILPAERSQAVIRDLRSMVEPDDHGGEAGYRITSLYYDSPDLDCFWAKIEGIKFRRKLRLRIYPGEDITKVDSGMVEIKQRVNRTVQKKRLKLPLPDAEALCRGEDLSLELDDLDRVAASEVHYLINALHLQPTCVISYWRKAFVGGFYDAGLRVTFDADLRSRVHELTVNADAPNHLWAPPDWCIMEVKANDSIPDWVTSLLARHNCQLHRVSKYCAGLAAARGIHAVPYTFPIGLTQERKHG